MKYRVKKVTEAYKDTVYHVWYYPQRRVFGLFWLYFKQDAGYEVVYDTEEKAWKYIEDYKKDKRGRHNIVEHIYEQSD